MTELLGPSLALLSSSEYATSLADAMSQQYFS